MPALRFPIRIALLCAVAWAVLCPASTSAQAPAEASRVRILLLIDDDAPSASINGFPHDHSAVKKALRETFHQLRMEDRYTLDVLNGKKAGRDKVLAYYRDLKTEA